MRTIVSRESAVYDEQGRKLCTRCKLRPRRSPPKGPRRRDQRYCAECQADYQRRWRAGKVQVMLTPEEWVEVKAARSLEASGRHARSIE